MAIKQIEQGKKNSFFKRADLIIYAFILLLVIVLFLTVFIDNDDEPLEGIKVVHMGQQNTVIFAYNFEKDSFVVHSDWQQLINVTPTESGYVVDIANIEQQGHFNRMIIDKQSCEVWVEDANCSLSRDCTRMDVIDNADKVIICVPHKLKILPLSPTYGNDIDLK